MALVSYEQTPMVASKLSEGFPLTMRLLSDLGPDMELHVFVSDLCSESLLSFSEDQKYWSVYPSEGPTEEAVPSGTVVQSLIDVSKLYEKSGEGEYLLNTIFYNASTDQYGDVSHPGVLIVQDMVYPGQ